MKRLLLVVILAIFGDCLALNKKDSVIIAAGTATAVGLWSWWGHVSNENAIEFAELLWKDCYSFVDKQDYCLSPDLEKTLYLLQASPVLKKKNDIIWAYKSLSRKLNWFWNRSYTMKQAYEKCEILKKSLDAYLILFDIVKQQIAIKKVDTLWSSFLKEGLIFDPNCQSIDSKVLQELPKHWLLINGSLINELYLEFYKGTSCCFEFEGACKKIMMIKQAYDKYSAIYRQVQEYDRIVETYQAFVSCIYQPYCKQDFVADAKRISYGEYPLLEFVKSINVDIKKLSTMTLNFSYIRLQGGGAIACNNALRLVEKHLKMVALVIVASSCYKKELRLQEERLMLERLRASVVRANYEIDRLKQEVDNLRHENLRLYSEAKSK